MVAAEDIALLGENTHHVSGRASAGSAGLEARSRRSMAAYWWRNSWSPGLRRWKESHKATAFVCFCSYFPDFSSMITFRRLRLCSNSANRTKPTSQQAVQVETCRSDPEEHQLNFCSRMFTPAIPHASVQSDRRGTRPAQPSPTNLLRWRFLLCRTLAFTPSCTPRCSSDRCHASISPPSVTM